MMYLLLPTLIGFLGLFIGGLMGKLSERILGFKKDYLMWFCGSLLLGLLVLELIPESIVEYPHMGLYLGFLLGVLMIIGFNRYLITVFNKKRATNTRFIISLAASIAVHNVPLGLTLGSQITAATATSTKLFSLLFFHLLPEGMTLAIPFFLIKNGFKKFLGLSVILSAIIGCFTIIGTQLHIDDSLKLNAWLIGIAIGSIGYLTIKEVLIPSYKNLNKQSFFLILIGGIVLTKIYFVFV